MLHGGIEHQIQVIYCRIMIFTMKTIGIYKMCIRCADLLCFLIHHLHKCILTACDLLGDHIGCIIGRHRQKCIQKLPKSKNISLFQLGCGYTAF